jgi:hypothetical protein
MVLTHMMVKRELNPLGWFLGLPLAVAAGWVWLDALYGTPVAYLAIVAGVVDIIIGIGPSIKEGHRQSRLVKKVEDGSSIRRTRENGRTKHFDRFNSGLRGWWFKDVLASHPDEVRTMKSHDGQSLEYVGFPLQTKDDSIFVFTAKRLITLDPRQCLVEVNLDRTNKADPVPETFLVENIGHPQIRIELEEGSLRENPSELLTPEKLAHSKALSEGETSRRELWVFKAMYNANEHGITMEMRSRASKGRALTEIIDLSPKKNMNEKQLGAMRFMLSVGYKVVDDKGWGAIESVNVGLFNHYKAVGIVITRKGENEPGYADPTIEPLLIDSDELKALNDRVGQ